MWSDGILEIGDEKVEFWIKYYSEGSEFGIDGGRISKLMVKYSQFFQT